MEFNRLVVDAHTLSDRARAFNEAMAEKRFLSAALELEAIQSSSARLHREVSVRLNRLERYRRISGNPK